MEYKLLQHWTYSEIKIYFNLKINIIIFVPDFGVTLCNRRWW